MASLSVLKECLKNVLEVLLNLVMNCLPLIQTEDVGLAVGGATYNQLVEKIITNRLSNDSVLYSQSLLAEQEIFSLYLSTNMLEY